MFLLDTAIPSEPKQFLEWDFQRWEGIPLAVLTNAKEFLHPLATHETLKSVAPDAFHAKGCDLVLRVFINSMARQSDHVVNRDASLLDLLLRGVF
jgi:hypothetical protein